MAGASSNVGTNGILFKADLSHPQFGIKKGTNASPGSLTPSTKSCDSLVVTVMYDDKTLSLTTNVLSDRYSTHGDYGTNAADGGYPVHIISTKQV